MKNYLYRIIFCALFFSSAQCAHATDYYWTLGGSTTTPQYSSPAAACQARASADAKPYNHVSYVSDTSFWCWETIGTTATQIQTVNRFGSSCPAGSSYFGQVGQCVAACTVPGQIQDANTGACSCPSGQSVYNGACVASCSTAQADFSFNTAGGTALNLGSVNQCIGSCGYTLTDTIPLDATGNNCSTSVDGSTKTCYFTGTGTGSHCSGTSSATQVTSPKNVGVKVTTATDASGNVTKTTTTTTVNTDGTTSTTTQIQTTPAGGSTTTSTSTVVGSTTGTATGTGSGSGNGTNGTGAGGSGDGAGDCDPTSNDYAVCIAGAQTPVNHTAGTAATFGDAFNNFESSVKTTPIGSLASSSGIGGTVDVGDCPKPTFEAFGRTYTIDAQCNLFDSMAATLTSVMHVVYIVSGILILLSA